MLACNRERVARCYDSSEAEEHEGAPDVAEVTGVSFPAPSLKLVEQGWSAHYSPAGGVGPDVEVCTHAPSEDELEAIDIVAGPLKASQKTRLTEVGTITTITIQRLTPAGSVVLFRMRSHATASPVARTLSALTEQSSTGDLDTVTRHLSEVSALYQCSSDALLGALTALPGGAFLSQFR